MLNLGFPSLFPQPMTLGIDILLQFCNLILLVGLVPLFERLNFRFPCFDLVITVTFEGFDFERLMSSVFLFFIVCDLKFVASRPCRIINCLFSFRLLGSFLVTLGLAAQRDSDAMFITGFVSVDRIATIKEVC